MFNMFAEDEQSSEEKKSKLRSYLEESGILKAITEVFDKLIQAKEKPEDPMHFVLQELGGSVPSQEIIDELEIELEETNREIEKLQKTLEGLRNVEPSKDEENTPDAGSSNAEA